MSKRSKGLNALQPSMKKTIQRLGENIKIARKRRRIPLRQMSERAMVSVPTLRKVEAGNPTVSLGIIVQILWVLQLHEGLKSIADPQTDVVGIQKERNRLPQKIHAEKDKINLDF